jgi:hypothetical protein
MWLGRAIAPYVHSLRSPLEWGDWLHAHPRRRRLRLDSNLPAEVIKAQGRTDVGLSSPRLPWAG